MVRPKQEKGGKALPPLQPTSPIAEIGHSQSLRDDLPSTKGGKSLARSIQFTLGSPLQSSAQSRGTLESHAGITAANQLAPAPAVAKHTAATISTKPAKTKRVKGRGRGDIIGQADAISREKELAKSEHERLQKDMENVLRERDDARVEAERLQRTV
ncbi:hypothetical protein FGG08_002556 [Glutinoglossum americanum]|uniref:Uncharacterized protein n=1 Tax=Glutinoglossum americanum TaxID=1670608 RepID=A0A9P8I4M8_9PEZI|nr:hypothetical protein FGG08_002556 [Glutinoglossum americanum]